MYPNITANAYLGSRYTSNADEEFTEQLKLNRGQGVGFTMSIPLDVNYLSRLPPEDVLHIIFAVCDDDTGNRYLKGLVKTTR